MGERQGIGRSRRGRTATIAAASAAAHLLLLSALAIEATGSRSVEPPDQPAIQVTLERPPRPPPPAPKPPVRKRVVPAPAITSAVQARSPAPAVHPAPPAAPNAPEIDAGETSAMGDLVRALRGSVGCDNPDAVGLTRDEREACRRRFHAGLEEAKPLSGVPAAKRERFERTVRCQNAYYGASMPNGHAASNGAGGMPGLGYVPRARDCPPFTQ